MSNSAASEGCGCFAFMGLMIFNLFLGGWLFDYCLWSILGRNIHWFGDMLCGLILGEICLPVAIVCFILRCFGLDAPFFGP